MASLPNVLSLFHASWSWIWNISLSCRFHQRWPILSNCSKALSPLDKDWNLSILTPIIRSLSSNVVLQTSTGGVSGLPSNEVLQLAVSPLQCGSLTGGVSPPMQCGSSTGGLSPPMRFFNWRCLPSNGVLQQAVSPLQWGSSPARRCHPSNGFFNRRCLPSNEVL